MPEIKIYNDSGKKNLPGKKLIEILSKVFKAHGANDANVSIIFLDDAKMLEMNKKYLNHDWNTDVLTFPMEEDIMDGEIYISVDTALRQAKEYQVPFRNEILRLAIHGALHLLDYDDITDEKRAKMTELENKYLQLNS
ncbi:MAG: rRNA maturation RNase YbeY [Ignavibacteria bacterium]|nr:rRNA maturation RNase YbeY [Ignavibacteria bacterium]